jgi:outer membrane protein OmpA-like peptidoglycan-associated protein
MRRGAAWLAMAAVTAVAGCASQPTAVPTPSQPVPPPSAGATMPHSAYQGDLENRITVALKTAVGLDTVWVSDGPQGAILIGLSPSVLFEPQGAVLRGTTLGALAQIAAVLQADPYAVVQILGPRPAAGNACPSYRLSDRQADALASYWLQLGFPPSRLRFQGRDEDCATAAPGAASGLAEWGHLQLLVRPLVAGAEPQAYQPLEVP